MANSVDIHGRVIPINGERVYSFSDRRYFCLEQPAVDLASIYERHSEFLEFDLINELTLAEFALKVEEIKTDISSNLLLSNLLKGVNIPFILPRKSLFRENPLEQLILAAGKSFSKMFSGFEFRNLIDGHLDDRVGIRESSKWDQIDAAWNEKTVVGLYFPSALSGFAISDHTTVINRLSDNLILSGIPEAASAFIGCPNLLIKTDGKYPNLLALTANITNETNYQHLFYFFEAYGWNLYFNRRSHIGAVSEYYSGGISVFA